MAVWLHLLLTRLPCNKSSSQQLYVVQRKNRKKKEERESEIDIPRHDDLSIYVCIDIKIYTYMQRYLTASNYNVEYPRHIDIYMFIYMYIFYKLEM